MTVHSCPKHQPGSPACYTRHKCRCTPCKTERTRQHKRSRAGLSGLVDVAPARDHIRSLVAAGWTYSAISAAAGLPINQAHYMATRARRTRWTNVRAILAVEVPHVGTVDAAGTRRRIQALMVGGWTTKQLCVELGSEGRGNTVFGYLRTSTVTALTAHNVAAVYERLWDQPGPSVETRRRALARGWVPAAAWDDDLGPHGIDNPDATPTGWKDAA